jgi:LysM repeat protein
MSDEGLTSQTPRSAAPGPASTAERASGAPVPTVCPYLLSADGAWRSSSAAREHRCTAVMPPSPLAAEKQRRLCLTADHVSCATFVAATEARAATRHPVDLRRPVARTTPLVLDQGRLAMSIPSIPSITSRPMASQGVLIGVLGIAFGAVLVARLATGGGSEGGVIIPVGSGSPTPTVTEAAVASRPPATPKLTAAPTPTAAPTTEPSPTLVPTGPTAKPTASPEKPTSYKVKRGDTLSGIAAQFGTTVKVLAELNDIKDPSKLHVGQVIKLP